jgi:protease PrsW
VYSVSGVGHTPAQPDPEQIAHNRRGLWLASLVVLVGLLLFVAVFNYFSSLFGQQVGGLALTGLGLLMSLVPAVLWLYFFYRMDRLEAEPKHKVAQTFILGVLVAAAIGQPFLRHTLDINAWLYANWWTQLLGGILLIGFVQEFVVYLVVRYGIFDDPEFDERVDGVIYATAAGLGLATVLNFSYVIEHGGVDLGIGSVRMVVNTLAHASFAGVLGYFLGQTRFERTPAYYMPAGLAIAALLNGLFFFLEDRVTATGFQINPWNGLLLAMVLAGLTLAVVFWLVARANEETLRVARESRQVARSSVVGTGRSDVDIAQTGDAGPEPAAILSEPADANPGSGEAGASETKDEGVMGSGAEQESESSEPDSEGNDAHHDDRAQQKGES